MEAFWNAPPVIRTLTAAVVATSCAAYANRSILALVYFDYTRAFWMFPPQVWRVFTAFLVSGPNLYIIMDPYFLFTYGKMLETSSPRFQRKADFAWYILFVMSVIMIVAGIFLGAPFMNEALMLAMVHTVAQDNPRMRAHLVILEIEARFLPYGLLALNFVTRGPTSAMVGAAGIFAAHAYDFLTRIWPTFGGGRNWIEPPAAFVNLFGEGGRAGFQPRSYGQAFTPAGAGSSASSGASTGRSTAASSAGASWRSRGVGRRLGE